MFQKLLLKSLTNFLLLLLFCFICYLAAPQPTLGHCQGGSVINPMFITTLYLFRPEAHWEPRNEVGSESLAEHLVGFEPGPSSFPYIKFMT